MKKQLFLLIICCLSSILGFSQSKPYFTSGGEMIFSFAAIQDNGSSENSTLRWAPVFNTQSMLNTDLSKHFGIFTGLALRNVGFIYDHYKTPSSPASDESVQTFRKKFRTYNIGIPIGFKFGNLENLFFYGGYEVEFPFLYKEKTFDGNDKTGKITEWFSNRTGKIQHGFLVGIQFPQGFNLKFKYYMSEFLNQDYVDGSGIKPYAGLSAHVFYFSICTNLFRNTTFQSPVKTTTL